MSTGNGRTGESAGHPELAWYSVAIYESVLTDSEARAVALALLAIHETPLGKLVRRYDPDKSQDGGPRLLIKKTGREVTDEQIASLITGWEDITGENDGTS